MVDLRKGGIVAAVLVAMVVVGVRFALPRVRPIEPASLQAILFQTEEYVGRRVEVSGTVRAFPDRSGTYYVLEDANQNRILLRSTDPIVAQSVNRSLWAIGTVGFDDQTGIYLDVESVSETKP